MFRVLGQPWRGVAAQSDPRLLALRAGDAAAIEEALLELLPSVRRWVYRRLGPDAAIDDVTQDVLSEIARALPSFDGRAGLTAYGYRICARVVARHMKRAIASREARLQQVSGMPAQAVQGDPERTAIERQALRSLLACLQRLPARRREAFILCELEGYSPQQAAELLDTTPNAVRSRVMHARRELERRLSRFRGGV